MPARVKPPWHRGTHQTRARAVVLAAYADSSTTCWRCGRTLTQHPPTKTGKPPTWEAGHLIDGMVDGPYAPEVKSCNASAGATAGNLRRRTKRTNLTW